MAGYQNRVLEVAGSSTILDLCLLKIKFGLPYFFDGAGFKVLKKLLARELIIRGMFCHFSTLVKLTELFSVIIPEERSSP